jgi:hypothetical protein
VCFAGVSEDWADWEDEDDTEATGDSLGAAIARQCRESTPGLTDSDTSPPRLYRPRIHAKVKMVT